MSEVQCLGLMAVGTALSAALAMITGASPALVPSPKGFIAWRDRDPVRYWESVLALGVISAVLAWTAFR